MRNIDLHMHTTVSDGTDTPEQILEKVREAGIVCFSVTDHDDARGCQMLREFLKEGDPQLIPGVEFSCRDERGKYHILGYGYDPDAEAFRQVVETGHGYRMHKVLARLEFLESEFGFSFSKEDRDTLLAMYNPGKPHIGNLMVKYGYTKTKEEAILQYIDKLPVRSMYARPEEAIEGIRESGGIPVLAHPSYGSGDQLILGDEMEERLQRLTACGLRGLEAFYSGFTDRLRGELLAFADQFDLLVTAGSDYHGTNKLVALGDTGLPETGEYPRRLQAFLEAVAFD